MKRLDDTEKGSVNCKYFLEIQDMCLWVESYKPIESPHVKLALGGVLEPLIYPRIKALLTIYVKRPPKERLNSPIKAK